jgi:hypothetical protein
MESYLKIYKMVEIFLMLQKKQIFRNKKIQNGCYVKKNKQKLQTYFSQTFKYLSVY